MTSLSVSLCRHDKRHGAAGFDNVAEGQHISSFLMDRYLEASDKALSLAVASMINMIRVGTTGRTVIQTLVRTRLPRVAMMGIVCGGSFLLLMEALAGGGAGYVLTLRNTSVLFAVGLAFAIGERPRRPEIIGATLVAAGAVLMGL